MKQTATTTQLHIQTAGAKVILHTVGIEYAVSADALKKKGRTATIAEARNVAMYLIRQLLRASYPDTADALGRPNHKSAQVAWKAVDTKKHRDPHFKARLARLTQSCKDGL